MLYGIPGQPIINLSVWRKILSKTGLNPFSHFDRLDLIFCLGTNYTPHEVTTNDIFLKTKICPKPGLEYGIQQANRKAKSQK
jgi:hypothetical protein